MSQPFGGPRCSMSPTIPEASMCLYSTSMCVCLVVVSVLCIYIYLFIYVNLVMPVCVYMCIYLCIHTLFVFIHVDLLISGLGFKGRCTQIV